MGTVSPLQLPAETQCYRHISGLTTSIKLKACHVLSHSLGCSIGMKLTRICSVFKIWRSSQTEPGSSPKNKARGRISQRRSCWQVCVLSHCGHFVRSCPAYSLRLLFYEKVRHTAPTWSQDHEMYFEKLLPSRWVAGTVEVGAGREF